jgi:putative flippase GtrA
VVGVVNSVFGYSVYALFIFFNFHYLVASLFSTILGVLFNFKTTGIFVFKSRNNNLIYKFVGVYIIVYLLNILLLKIFSVLHLNLYVAGAMALLPVAVISFTLNKKYVFCDNCNN